MALRAIRSPPISMPSTSSSRLGGKKVQQAVESLMRRKPASAAVLVKA